MNSAATAQAVSIADNAMVAIPEVAEGRLIPLLILETESRPDLAEVIEAQRHLPPGDVMTQWCQLAGRFQHMALLIRFIRPTECEAIIEFDIAKNGGLVELMLHSKALQIQAGKAGDKIKDQIHRPKMILEIPDTGFGPQWDKIYFDALVKHARKAGLNRAIARESARAHIEKIKVFGKSWSTAGSRRRP